MLDLAAREGNKAVALEEIKHTLAQQIRDDAYMVPEIKAVPQVDAFVAVGFVVRGQSREHAQFNPGGVTVLLDGADDFDGTARFPLFVIRFDDLTEGTLTQEFDNRV